VVGFGKAVVEFIWFVQNHDHSMFLQVNLYIYESVVNAC